MSTIVARIEAARPSGFLAGLAFVAVYVALKTIGAPEALVTAWTVLASAAAVVSPLFGLTVLAAIGPFTGALDDDGRITAVPFLLASVGAGVLLRVVHRALMSHWQLRLDARAVPVALAILLMLVTALGVGNTWLLYGIDRARLAAELWVPGIGGALTVLIASAWLAGRGELRPLYVLVASVAAAAAISTIDFATAGGVNASVLGWLVHTQFDASRLGGIILAPNAAATIFLVGAIIAWVIAISSPGRLLLVVALVAVGICLVAVLLTRSRSGMIALALVGVVVGWRWRRWRGLGAMAVVGAVITGVFALATAGAVLRDVSPLGDEQRLGAWRAAIGMWVDQPLTGVGFRAFEWLHAAYGTVLDAPHNEWLRFFAEEGIAGGVIAAVFVGSVIVAAARSPGRIGTGVLAGALALVVMTSFNNLFLYAQVNIPAFMLLGCYLVTRSEDDESPHRI